jgi:hypothetical protein
MVVHIYNPTIWEAEVGGGGDLASLDYIVKPRLKKKKIVKLDDMI